MEAILWGSRLTSASSRHAPLQYAFPERLRFFCSFLRSALLVERLGMDRRFTPMAWAAASFLAEKNAASAVAKRGTRPRRCRWTSIAGISRSTSLGRSS